ncbi:glutamine synthetase family protein [Prosthecodimorpha hirschii]|uniref:glutamine synthetase family protein n=1 Tax=Prosthecodimorpha hirschii TaxID=665126 RepID=UPI001FEFAFA4|nr:glutamine synthetase family protein [Prosthecomicrobium hirschii]
MKTKSDTAADGATTTGAAPAGAAPTGASLEEAHAFLERHPDVQGIDVVMPDFHGIGRGKIIRRHELDSLYRNGRGMPGSLFGQDVAGDDVEESGLILVDGGADMRVWPLPGTLGYLPKVGRGQVLVGMCEADGSPFEVAPRTALLNQIARARAAGFEPMGAFELEFYLVDRQTGPNGRRMPATYALTGRRSMQRNTMSVDELDEMSPLFEAIYEAAAASGLTLESLISEYGPGQYELTIRYRDLIRAADDVVLAKRLVRTVARRFGVEATFMAKPFGQEAGSGMHLHLSLGGEDGRNLFADQPDGSLSPLMLHAIGGIRKTIGDTMLILAPYRNSWRRFASAVYSPASDSWGVENRTVALRVPGLPGATRHFEHRVAGVDANPYLVGAVTLAGALDGIRDQSYPGPAAEGNNYEAARPANLPRSWIDAIDRMDGSDFVKRTLGERMHRAFVAVKRAEWLRLELDVSEAEWELYGFVV